MATTAEVAKDFTDLLKAGDHEGAAAKYNSPDIVSIEAMDGPMARLQGTAAVQAKGEWFYSNHDIHAFSAEGPYVNGDQFIVNFYVDLTPKETGQRNASHEMGLYTVKDGKIVEERFYY
jgi:ketosteroid isomerase-like protein